jgi:acetyl esterase/lipase
MATATPPPVPYVVEDCLGVLQLLSDGTVIRSTPRPFPAGDSYDDGRVEWKDAVYDANYNLGVRIYKPRRGQSDDDEEKKKKLPVLVYFHGGGFCFGSYSWPKNHVGCLRIAAELPAIVLSFDYRLAPEHRLPAAVDDAEAALLWLPRRMSSDPWLAANASPHQVFVCGQSSGANLAHHLLVRIGSVNSGNLGLGVKIAGYILLMPPFLSKEPTRSELEAPATALLSREMSDKYFRLGFPVGANKDDPLANPFGTVEVGRMLVVAAECDLVRDKNVEYAERMTAMGKDVELVVFPGEEHAFFATKPLSRAADELVGLINRFIHQ